MLRNYLVIAYRNLINQKWFSVINVMGLAIGLAVAILIGLWVHDELSYNTYHDNYDRLARVMMNAKAGGEVNTNVGVALPLKVALEEEYGEDFTYLAAGSWNWPHKLSYGDTHISEEGMAVQSHFPEMLSLELLSGSYEEALKEPNTIMLKESLAKALFGEEDAYGKILTYDNDTDLKVTAVYKDLPDNSSLKETDFLTTWALYENQNSWVIDARTNWENNSFQIFAQIAPNTSFEDVSEKIKDIKKEFVPIIEPELFLFPMSKWHLYSDFEDGQNIGGRIKYVWLFGLTGIFVLLLACINFMNLSTARSEKRVREVGIRKSVGSLRTQLVGQFLSESLLVSFLAAVISLVLIQLAIPFFNELADKEFSLPLTNPFFWLVVISFTVLTGLLAGSYPAFYLSSFHPLQALKGGLKVGKWATIPREALVVFQFVISIALIVGTLVVFQQINHAKERTVGYDREGLIHFMTNNQLSGKFDVLRTELLRTGYVEEAAVSMSPVTGVWSNASDISWEGKRPDEVVTFARITCSPEYGKTVGWNILEGRDFSREFATDSSALIFNEKAASIIGGGESIVGNTVKWGGDDMNVIGVSENMLMGSPWQPVQPAVFVLSDVWVNVHTVRMKTGAPVAKALEAVEEVFATLSPNTPFDYTFTDEAFGRKFVAEERIKNLARIFAFLAIFISCMGLFGLSSYLAEQRTKEIGIRKVLGATVKHLWALQSRNFMKLVLISCLIAIPVAWYYLESWLKGYEYRVSLEWEVFLIASLLALGLTLITVSIQSVKAATANPVDSLRSE
ncbi:MAG: FtsX-like permease family protein [Bacteroidota bacterium]